MTDIKALIPALWRMVSQSYQEQGQMVGSINRMQFLRGDFRGDGDPLRPPWALSEELFLEKCTGCGDCIPACPGNLVSEGRGKYPQLDFSKGGCDFCRECVDVCKPGALHYDETADPIPWNLKATILPSCLSLNAVMCRSCGDACDVRAIRFRLEPGGVAKPVLDQEQCTGCGECFAVCPIKAVKISSIQPRDQAA